MQKNSTGDNNEILSEHEENNIKYKHLVYKRK